MQTPIVLIGPMSAGKSTVGALLAQALNLPNCALDDIRWAYYDAAGFDHSRAKAIVENEGTLGILRYMKTFEASAVEQVVVDHSDSVIDFGAGHSVHEDPALFDRVARALQPLANVILLLPDPDPDISIQVLNRRFAALLQREVGHVDPDILQVNEQFVRHPANGQLAKITAYTEEKTAAQVCQEILGQLQ